jgi:hypothetical protein
VKDYVHSLLVFLLTATFPGILMSQERVKPVTVCEVFDDLKKYGNSVVAVVGRMEVMGSLIDHYEYLSQSHCDQPLVTQGYVWPTKILIWQYWEEGMPKPPTDEPQFDRDVLVKKLAAVRKVTALGSHNEYRLDKRGVPGEVSVPNDWVIVYGRAFVSPHLAKEPCEEVGCNGFTGHAPVVIMVDPKNIRILNEDATTISSPAVP